MFICTPLLLTKLNPYFSYELKRHLEIVESYADTRQMILLKHMIMLLVPLVTLRAACTRSGDVQKHTHFTTGADQVERPSKLDGYEGNHRGKTSRWHQAGKETAHIADCDHAASKG